MSLAMIYTRANNGIAAPLVSVEAHIAKGLPGFLIVGLPEAVVKESRDRVRSALVMSGFEFPYRRITVNLAPADLPKSGSRFDLAIALSILAASSQIPNEGLETMEFVGELGLTGELRSVPAVLPMVISSKQSGRMLILPSGENAMEAAIVKNATVLQANHLLAVCSYLKNEITLRSCDRFIECETVKPLDLIDVKGQFHARAALEIAAAGKHSLLFLGPPGAGKTMLASRLPSILPILSEEQALEVAMLFSVSSNGFDPKRWQQIPFRSPHHSSSSIALVGGGRPPRPGEISLAHHGVLFLDELPEFQRHVIESLREPMESGQVTISRAQYQTHYPAQFQFIAAMNPCPCGYVGSHQQPCHCTIEQIRRYRAKLSGPLLDRIDLQVEVDALSPEFLIQSSEHSSESSATVKERVERARDIQLNRQGKCNANLMVSEVETHCKLDTLCQTLLSGIVQKFNFSARVYHRLLKVARTIADLSGSSSIKECHLSEALSFRSLDKNKFKQ